MLAVRIAPLKRLLMLLGMASILCSAAPPVRSIYGIWQNPRGSVRVRAGPCGAALCGWVVWASAQAIQDAREGGTEQLVGTEIMHNYKQTSAAHWEGQVFVPDMGNRFFSTIRQIADDRIKVSGCILHGLICKSQLWERL